MTSMRGPMLRVAIYLMLIAAALKSTPIARSQQRTRPQHSSRTKSVASKLKSSEWPSFRGPDNDFTLEFPSEPKRVEDLQGSVTVLRRYALTTQSSYFEISIQDTGGVPSSSYANEFSPNFEQTISQMMGEDGIKIVQLRRTTKGSYEMEVLSPTLDRKDYLHGLRRGLIRNGRIYSMACDSLIVGKDADRSICRRFFNSFRIVGLPQ
jgi:hypothetical protein